jgi:hypothetical protein
MYFVWMPGLRGPEPQIWYGEQFGKVQPLFKVEFNDSIFDNEFLKFWTSLDCLSYKYPPPPPSIDLLGSHNLFANQDKVDDQS